MKKINIILIISTIIAVLLISSSVFYYYVVHLPRIHKEDQNLENKKQEIETEEKEKKEQEDILNELLLKNCLESAETKAKNQKEEYMESIVGTKTSSETIEWSLDETTERLYKERDECYVRYFR